MDFMFEDEVDEVGSDVEAYCPKCKADTTHVVISKYEEEIRRVQCNPCGDVHSFRKPRGEAEDDVPEPVAARKRAMLKKPGWEEFFARRSPNDAKPYEFREHYRENLIVHHPKFGVGFVSEVVSDSKVEITFQDARRILVHNRRDIPGLPLAAEGDGMPTPARAPRTQPKKRPARPPRRLPAKRPGGPGGRPGSSPRSRSGGGRPRRCRRKDVSSKDAARDSGKDAAKDSGKDAAKDGGKDAARRWQGEQQGAEGGSQGHRQARSPRRRPPSPRQSPAARCQGSTRSVKEATRPVSQGGRQACHRTAQGQADAAGRGGEGRQGSRSSRRQGHGQDRRQVGCQEAGAQGQEEGRQEALAGPAKQPGPSRAGAPQPSLGARAAEASQQPGGARSGAPAWVAVLLANQQHVDVVEGVCVDGDREAAEREQQAEEDAGQGAEGEDVHLQRIAVGRNVVGRRERQGRRSTRATASEGQLPQRKTLSPR